MLGGGAFVVVVVGAGKFYACNFVDCRIVNDAEEFWQNFLADLFGEGLAFFFVALAVTFQAMAEDLMKKHGGSAAAEKSGTVVGLSHRSFAEIAEVGGHFFDF